MAVLILIHKFSNLLKSCTTDIIFLTYSSKDPGSLALQADSLPSEPPGKPNYKLKSFIKESLGNCNVDTELCQPSPCVFLGYFLTIFILSIS